MIYVCPACGYETEQPDTATEVVCFNVTKHKSRNARAMKEKK